MRQGETGDKGYLTDYVVCINHNMGGKMQAASQVSTQRVFSLNSTVKGKITSDC